jgi:hypothetical protein
VWALPQLPEISYRKCRNQAISAETDDITMGRWSELTDTERMKSALILWCICAYKYTYTSMFFKKSFKVSQGGTNL